MEERLGRLVAITGKVVRERFNESLASVDSSLNTYVILRTVHHNPSMSQRQLAAALGIEGPTMTHHLDRLAADGYILRVRDPGDRRAYRVELTADGKAHLDRVETYAHQLDDSFRSLFTSDEVATLRELLTRIRDHFCEETHVRTD